jgi:cell division transport system ATP-binding protein
LGRDLLKIEVDLPGRPRRRRHPREVAKVLRDFRADFVTAGANCGANPSLLDRPDRTRGHRQHPGRKPSPARVHRRDPLRAAQQHGHTVGGDHLEHDLGLVGPQRVGLAELAGGVHADTGHAVDLPDAGRGRPQLLDRAGRPAGKRNPNATGGAPRTAHRPQIVPSPAAACALDLRNVIRFFNVSKRYGPTRVALDNVSFDVERGELVLLTGPSGAGKSTLLRLIFREEVPSDGQILVNGRNVASLPTHKIPYLRRSIGVVFQDFRLIARRTVFENVSYLPRVLGMDSEQQRRVVLHTLKRVGLAHRSNDFPMQLSGGEQQRVAIARALVNEPELLLADEPTGNLDPGLSEEISGLFREISLRGTTVILATHSPEVVERLGKRVLHLVDGRLTADNRSGSLA